MVSTSGEGSLERVVTEGEKTVAEQSTMPTCQMSSSTVEFDRGEEPLMNEPKLAEFSLADLLSDRMVSLVKYLDGKMAKYSVPTYASGSYVELVRKRTKATGSNC